MNDQAQQYEPLQHAWLLELPARRYTDLMKALTNLQTAHDSYDTPAATLITNRLVQGTLVGQVGAMAAEHSEPALAAATEALDRGHAETVSRILTAEEEHDQRLRLVMARTNYERSAQAYRPQPAVQPPSPQPLGNTNFASAA